ncbi:MAG: hypothetical protein KUG77_21935 [Nannocystaceae bacterium]|nr:hypothetical protein [Nannocystaceae bacterium]
MRALAFGLATALGLGGAATADAQPWAREPTPVDPAPAKAPDAVDVVGGEPEPPTASENRDIDLLDRILPCGTRVLIARDDSLPVASVVLALEHGSEDDPDDLPGLHHALAYQLLMGNRDTAPGGIQSMVQDAGGIAFLATGPAQTRFESLIPITLLGEVIAAEAGRFRAPTVTESLWKETLISARRDTPHRRTASWHATAVAHGSAGLAHRPRVVPKGLGELDVASIEAALAQRARYEFATLVVVSPLPLEDTFAKVESAMRDLPERPRRVPARDVMPSGRVVEQPKAAGNTFVWAIPGEPAARLWADAWCETVSRQRRGKGEPKPNRVRCAFDDDPRRPTVTIRVRTPSDPSALLEARMQRLAGKGGRVLRGPRRRLQRMLASENSTPLGLARRLAAAATTSATAQDSIDVATGVTALQGSPPDVATVLPLDQAVRVVAPGTVTPASSTPPSADPHAVEPASATTPAAEPTDAATPADETGE